MHLTGSYGDQVSGLCLSAHLGRQHPLPPHPPNLGFRYVSKCTLNVQTKQGGHTAPELSRIAWQAADEGLLLRCWSKLRDGGILAGGYARPDSVDGAMRAAVIAFAETTSRQPLLGLDAEHAGIWLVRK